jgi:hypothetical protein
MSAKTKVRANGAAEQSTAVMNPESAGTIDVVSVPPVDWAQVEADTAELAEANERAENIMAVMAARDARPTVSLNDRLEALEQLQRLAERHHKLVSKKRELDTVREANERGACVVSFIGDGEQVEVKNPDIIREALGLMGDKLGAFIKDTESEICALNV